MLLIHNDLAIRNATPADAALLEKWWNDGEVMAHAGFPLGTGEKAEDIAARIARETEESRRLILELDGRPIGEMNYGPNGDRNSAWLGVKICETAQQERGYGKIFLSMLIRWLFEAGYQKVTVDPDRENRRSRHVYERLGFRQVRVRENAWTDQLGAPHACVDCELTSEDFVDFAK